MLLFYLTIALLTNSCFAGADAPRLLRRQAVPSTTCTTTAIEPVPSGLYCGVGGIIAHPNEIKPPFTVPESSSQFVGCRNDCLTMERCMSFSFERGTNLCTLYGSSLYNQGIKDTKMMSGIVYYDHNCFVASCGPTSTYPARTKTITSTATSNSTAITTIMTTITRTITTTTSSTSSTSSAPAGPPTCTQAANPSGTCAYAADYNGGTAPQLWAGPASSLDACAILCAGEPGCRSLAYNSAGTLPCVLFNTVTNGLTTNSDAGSSTMFYDSTCFTCSGTAPLPRTDDNCTPALNPPGNSQCDSPAIWAGIPPNLLSANGNTASSLGACMQQCLAQSTCESISFDGSNCQLFSVSVTQLEFQGLAFPVDPGVSGSSNFYDINCLVCSTSSCVYPPPVKKRELARREAGVERREAELERRILAVEDRERLLAVRDTVLVY